MNKNTHVSLSIFILSITLCKLSYADSSNIPNAGDISRQVEQQTSQALPTVEVPTINQSTINDEDDTPIDIQNINVIGSDLINPADIQPLLDEYIGQTTTFGGLQRLTQQIARVYHQAGYPLVTVVVPPQRIENGEVTLQVIEGSVNQVSVNNQSNVTDKVVTRYVKQAVAINQPLKQTDSERALLHIKDLAGTDLVTYQIDGSNEGTNLIVNLEPEKAIDGFVNIDNYGSESTGEWRTRAGVNLNSPFGRGEQISLQAMSSFQGVNYAKLNGELPIGYDGLRLTGGVAHTTYDLGGDFKNLEATGTADTINLGLSYPVLRSNKNSVWASVNGEYRDLQDEIGATDTVTDKTLQAVNMGLQGAHRDSMGGGGYTQWSLTNTFGKLDIESDEARAIDANSAQTQGDYHKISASLRRSQYLSPRFSLNGSVSGQWANQNLDSAEQLSLGGVGAVTAYEFNALSADLGVLGQIELNYILNPYLSLNAFYDIGRAEIRETPYTTGYNTATLQGIGVGANAQYKNWYLQGKVAWQTGDDLNDDSDDPVTWVNAGYRF